MNTTIRLAAPGDAAQIRNIYAPFITESAASFEIDQSIKYRLLNGLDDIGLTLRRSDMIKAFEERHLAAQPWLGNMI